MCLKFRENVHKEAKNFRSYQNARGTKHRVTYHLQITAIKIRNYCNFDGEVFRCSETFIKNIKSDLLNAKKIADASKGQANKHVGVINTLVKQSGRCIRKIEVRQNKKIQRSGSDGDNDDDKEKQETEKEED